MSIKLYVSIKDYNSPVNTYVIQNYILFYRCGEVVVYSSSSGYITGVY